MALIDLVEYRQRLELQQSTLLSLSLVFNETEKQEVAIIYKELIAICDKAIARNTEKETIPFHSY